MEGRTAFLETNEKQRLTPDFIGKPEFIYDFTLLSISDSWRFKFRQAKASDDELVSAGS